MFHFQQPPLSSTWARPAERVIVTGLKTCPRAEAWCGWQASPASANDSDARMACPDPHQTHTHTRTSACPLYSFWRSKQTYLRKPSVDRETNTFFGRTGVWESVGRIGERFERRWESEYASKSLVFVLIGLEAVSCSQTAAERDGYRLF